MSQNSYSIRDNQMQNQVAGGTELYAAQKLRSHPASPLFHCIFRRFHLLPYRLQLRPRSSKMRLCIHSRLFSKMSIILQVNYVQQTHYPIRVPRHCVRLQVFNTFKPEKGCDTAPEFATHCSKSSHCTHRQ